MKKRARAIQERPHQQVWIRHGDHEAEVDKRLAPLMLECWKRDIWAIHGCEGGPSRDAHIQFQSFMDATAFLNAVCAKSESWHFDAVPYDFSSEGEPAQFELTVTMHFPRRDIPRMLRALRPAVRLLEAVPLAVTPVDGAMSPAADK